MPRGVDSFLCLCDQDICTKPEFPVSYMVRISNSLTPNLLNVLIEHQLNSPLFTKVYSRTEELELVELNALAIEEGDNTIITTLNINVVLDYPKYGIRDAGILFSTIPNLLPKYGRLVLELWEKSGALQTFTLLDLATDKVGFTRLFSFIFGNNEDYILTVPVKCAERVKYTNLPPLF